MKLKEYLKLNKISNKEFSKLIGITPVSLSRYISGERIPEKEIVLKIFEFKLESYDLPLLGISKSELSDFGRLNKHREKF